MTAPVCTQTIILIGMDLNTKYITEILWGTLYMSEVLNFSTSKC
jgi:hypothetical protein